MTRLPMNIRLATAAFATCAGLCLVAACTDTDPDTAEGRLHTLQFTATATDTHTRAAEVDNLSFHNSFGVFAAAFPADQGYDEGQASTFMHNVRTSRPDGQTYYQTDGTFFIPGSGTDLRIFAYAPYGAITPTDAGTAVPSYTFYTQSDVTMQTDFCVARPADVAGGSENGVVNLNFEHVLVGIRFTAGTVPAGGRISRIALTGVMSGGVYRQAGSGGSWTGWAAPAGGTDEITVTLDTDITLTGTDGQPLTGTGETFMLIPGSVGGELQVDYDPDGTPGNGDERTLTASLADDKALSSAGTIVTYRISVRDFYLYVDRVDVTPWGGEGIDEQVNSSVLPDPAPESYPLKPGDYYYSDGTFSDGGLRGINADDGKLQVARIKPAPLPGKTVVGIVAVLYADNPAPFADAEIQALKDKGVETPTALVVATKEAGRFYWSDEEYAEYNVPDIADAFIGNSNDCNGLANCQALQDIGLEHFPAAQAAMNYEAAIPAETTGWFLPAAGQWRHIHRGLAGASFPRSDDTRAWYNYWLSLVPDDQRTLLEYDESYGYFNECWSSTEAYDSGNTSLINSAATWQISHTGLVMRQKHYIPTLSENPVRAVLVF